MDQPPYGYFTWRVMFMLMHGDSRARPGKVDDNREPVVLPHRLAIKGPVQAQHPKGIIHRRKVTHTVHRSSASEHREVGCRGFKYCDAKIMNVRGHISGLQAI